ncbi:MAG TPA: hypothetical protein VG253_17860 [Streptosporangiaceae bacterium]|jgi:negative regulator of replication initiation|nr:hypothetical protein [Streptosporangiaceae bacterium]
MQQLTVADDVYEQITLLTKAWGISASDVIGRLLRDFRGTQAETAPTKAGQVTVHAIYAGSRTEGLYDPAVQSLTITTGPLAGKTFSKPSGAAVALVAALRPGVHPNRNGWSFWVESRTGRRLQAIRYKPAQGS